MIVSDNNIQTALEYLAIDPHPVALAHKFVRDAENKRKEVMARIFLEAEGSVEARKATAECDTECVAAKAEEAEAVLELERHRARSNAAEMLIEVWRSENANARAAERVR